MSADQKHIEWALEDKTTGLVRRGEALEEDSVDVAFWLDTHHCDYFAAKLFGLAVIEHPNGCAMLPAGQCRFEFKELTVDGVDHLPYFNGDVSPFDKTRLVAPTEAFVGMPCFAPMEQIPGRSVLVPCVVEHVVGSAVTIKWDTFRWIFQLNALRVPAQGIKPT